MVFFSKERVFSLLNNILWIYGAVGVLGCGTLASKKGCEQANLYELGYKDARAGRRSSFDQYANLCNKRGVKLNKVKYKEGREAGLKELCTYKTGYQMGLIGQQYQGVCPDDKARGFLQGYSSGLIQHMNGQEALLQYHKTMNIIHQSIPLIKK